MSLHRFASPMTARLWLDEFPQLRSKAASSWAQRSQNAASSAAPKRHAKIALEVLIPRGAHFVYGLLGAEFTPSHGDEFVVRVSRDQAGEKISDWSLARGLDEVTSDIPAWAIEVILDAASSSGLVFSTGSGVVQFVLGGHGTLGSNKWVFRGLSKCIVELISLNTRCPSQAELASYLHQNLL